jgi:hypothetical protein
MNTEQELRPCPFCGGSAKWADRACNIARVKCTACGASVYGPESRNYDAASSSAIAAWNRRSSDEQAEVVGWMHPVWIGRLANGEISQPVLRPTNEGRSDLIPLYASPPAVAAGGVTDQMVDLAWRRLNGAKYITPDDVRAALSASLAVGDEGIRPDLLAEMAKHPGWSIERGYRDRGDDEGGPYGWCVYEVRGGRSDLEWDLIGFGETPHEALSAAVAALPTPPSRGAGE